jgi:hypothetical protein
VTGGLVSWCWWPWCVRERWSRVESRERRGWRWWPGGWVQVAVEVELRVGPADHGLRSGWAGRFGVGIADGGIWCPAARTSGGRGAFRMVPSFPFSWPPAGPGT